VKQLLEECHNAKYSNGDWMLIIKLDHIDLMIPLFTNINNNTCAFLDKLKELLYLL
jgi:hypothetical protein